MSSFLVNLLIYASVVLQVFCHEEEIYTRKYNENNFVEEIAKKHHFVMFYAPWCGHCQRLAPIWEQLAEMLNEDSSNIRIAKVDCTTDAQVCSDQDITGYPTLKFFKVGTSDGVRFRGTRDFPTLTDFINEQARQGDELSAGVVASQESPLIELNKDNFDAVIEDGHTFIKFYAPWCGHCQQLAPTWLELAKAMELSEQITIAKVDCTEFRDICSTHDVKGYPTLFWFEDGQKKGKYTGDRSLVDLKNYVNQMIGGQVPEKSEPEPTKVTEDKFVTELTAKNFSDEIGIGLTFVEFYSPSCGHCKRLAPTWEQLGKKFQSEKAVKIGKIDCTTSVNRQFCNEQKIEGFPTLFLYKDAQQIGEYNGNRDIEDLSDFVTRHLWHEEL